MRSIRTRCVLSVLVGLFLTTLATAQLPNPGSVLIFPVQRSDNGLFTVLSITNTKKTPGLAGSTLAHFEYVNVTPNPADPFKPLNCLITNRIESLTPADTLSVMGRCHNPGGPGGHRNGYLVVTALNPSFGNAWSHNYLIGSEIVITAGGAMFTINAIPFQSTEPDGANADIVANGRADFDGVEYSAIPDVLYADSFVALGGDSLALLSLSGSPNDVTNVLLYVWNDNEFALSQSISFKCWFELPLTQISGLFTEAFLLGTPHDPTELDVDCDGIGDLESGWIEIDSTSVISPGGALVTPDAALLGCITAGFGAAIEGGKLLWGSAAVQTNGSF